MTTRHILASWRIKGKGAVRVHEPETGKTVKEFKILTSPYSPICQVSASQFAVSCESHALCLCNADDGSVTQTFLGHNGDGRGLESIPSANLLASGTLWGELFLWDLNPEVEVKKRGELRGHSGDIFRLINPKSLSHLLLSSGGADKTVRVWDWGREECLKLIDDHTDSGYGLAFNEEAGIMMTGGCDKRVMMWDLKNNYASIGEIGPFPSVVAQMFYRESSHRLSVVASTGEVLAYDVRNISTPLLEFDAIHGSLHGCDMPDQDVLCLTSWLNKKMSAWKDDGSVAWSVPENSDNEPYGVCRFTTDSSYTGGVEVLGQTVDGSVDAIIEAIESKMICVVTIKGTHGSMVRVPRSMCAREVLDETLHVEVNLETVSEKELLLLLTGTRIAADTPTFKLLFLGRLFLALHLPAHLYLLCQCIANTSDPVRVASLALSCDALVAKLEDWEGDDGEEVDGLDAIPEAILRALVRLDWSTRPVLNAFRRTSSPFGFVMCQFLAVPARPLSEHPDFSNLDSAKLCDGFQKLFDQVSADLHESRRFTNAALTTSDGGKEEVHVEILLSRSSFFHHMLSFGGAELESLKKTKTIVLENFTSDELSAYVSWIYLGRYPKSVSFRILVRLLTHFHMHGETGAETAVLQGCLDRIRSLEQEELILRLMENGHLIMNSLPEDLQIRLVSCAARRLGFREEGVRSFLSFADELGSRVDERDSKIEQQAQDLSECVCRKRLRSEEDGNDSEEEEEEDSDSADSKEANKKKRRKLNPD